MRRCPWSGVPSLDVIERVVPSALLFVVGLGVILASFKLLDHVLPQVTSGSTVKRAAWMRRPWTMFALGCIVATLTLSVSVALTVLIPLAVKGYVRRDEALPYIMGANITTLADTLVVAMLQRDPVAAQIVLAEAIGVTIVSLAILAFWYQPVKRGVIRLDDYFVGSTRRMAIFVGILFVLPGVVPALRTLDRPDRPIGTSPAPLYASGPPWTTTRRRPPPRPEQGSERACRCSAATGISGRCSSHP